MTETDFPASYIDANGRRPYLPHDHRHTGYKPTRETVAQDICIRETDRLPAHDEFIDRLVEIGSLYGVDAHTIPKFVEPVISASLKIYVIEAVDFAVTTLPDDLTPGEKSDLDMLETNQIEHLEIVATVLANIKATTEAAAVAHHVIWMQESTKNLTIESLEEVRSRSLAHIDDVSEMHRERLGKLIKRMDDLICAYRQT